MISLAQRYVATTSVSRRKRRRKRHFKSLCLSLFPPDFNGVSLFSKPMPTSYRCLKFCFKKSNRDGDTCLFHKCLTILAFKTRKTNSELKSYENTILTCKSSRHFTTQVFRYIIHICFKNSF